jgi:serine/threonine protein phosphatase PrpC
VSKFSHRNDVGFLPDNPGKVNQDSFIEAVNFARNPDQHFFGVCDGHGFYGREVSSFLKQRLPTLLAQDSALGNNPRKALTNCILRCDSELLECPFDVNFSGSTLNVVLIQGKTLWCANVGDSRSIVARQLSEGSKPSAARQVGRHWMCIALSRDHKPDDKDESTRILRAGGRIEAYQDEEGNPLGPARVWLMDQDIPGLAMSRSMGDGVAASVGVFSEPEILEFAMTPEDKFLVVGSDGVFEFLSNEEIVKLVVPFWKANDVQGACDAVAQEARTRWTTVSVT